MHSAPTAASVAVDPGVQKIAAANTQFGFQMLRQLDQKADGANVFFSPLSVSSALSVVLTGAGGQTQKTIAGTLGLAGLAPADIDRANGLLLLHKAVLEVDEEGTVAAAVTAVTTRHRAVLRVTPKEMRVDRPFFCAIRDNETSTLLFAGIIRDPQ